jgi:succinate dehydrogenase hydrophobic anchor subunit
MNWNLIAFTALMAIFVVAFLIMLYFQWVDGYVRKWRWERKVQENEQ